MMSLDVFYTVEFTPNLEKNNSSRWNSGEKSVQIPVAVNDRIDEKSLKILLN